MTNRDTFWLSISSFLLLISIAGAWAEYEWDLGMWNLPAGVLLGMCVLGAGFGAITGGVMCIDGNARKPFLE